jgi:sirohydrochlorin cobaltochelatase
MCEKSWPAVAPLLNAMPHATAILLIGHGTRDAAGTDEFLTLAKMLAERMAPTGVFPCFLELASPSIGEAVAAGVDAGARNIVAVPVLLFAAGHAKSDIPAALADAVKGIASERRVEVSIHQTSVLECHPRLLELSRRRYEEAMQGLDELPASTTCLILVGRGSYDREAVAAMHRFTELRAATTAVGQVEAAFIAMATPKYGEVLRRAAARGFARIVVQPHLLFAGELLSGLQRDVATLANEFPLTQWVVTSHLGPDALLTDAVESSCQAAIAREEA